MRLEERAKFLFAYRRRMCGLDWKRSSTSAYRWCIIRLGCKRASLFASRWRIVLVYGRGNCVREAVKLICHRIGSELILIEIKGKTLQSGDTGNSITVM